MEGIGESWEISSVEDNVSVVANGSLKGTSLEELLRTRGAEIMGEQIYKQFGTTFPLLIKFIDARDNLSIQVHPDDALAQQRHQSFGKTEMWYVINAAPEAFLYTGFNEQLTPQTYVERVGNNTITDALQRYDVEPGDVFFLPAGRVHAIGAGCFIAEIQQTSNITYRIYDYNRRDANGNKRELHTELAKDAINFEVLPSYKTDYTATPNQASLLVKSDYFTTNIISADQQITRDYHHIDSFVVLIGISGEAQIETHGTADSITLTQGNTILIPATLAETIRITPISQSPVKILETYIAH